MTLVNLRRYTLLCLVPCLLTPAAFADGNRHFSERHSGDRWHETEFRSIDGTGNNLVNPELNAVAGAQLKRRMDDKYVDQLSQMPYRGNPRMISNALASQSQSITPSRHISDFVWQWGQFLDHDIDLTETLDSEPANIPIMPGDPVFPAGEMTFHRSIYDPASGIDGPRQQVNLITGYIDASNVYGSDPLRAAMLRSDDSSITGHMRTSAGGLLSFDTDGISFLSGDVRANEQIGLTAMHTLFVREHNRLADRIVERHPGLAGNGDLIYELARRLVGAQMQAITYNEFIPALLGYRALSPYGGYKPNVDARIMNEFSTAAFRLGHSMLSPQILRVDMDGNEIPAGHVALRDAFFSPGLIVADGIDPILRGLAKQRAQAVDVYIIDDVRNFLFAPPSPAMGGFDLASLNIHRGRDHGLPSYNQARVAMGMKAARSFADISSDRKVQQRLANAYTTVDDIDLWAGGLAEDHVKGALVGKLFYAILREQFENLRDGDRFWYERSLSRRELRMIRNTRLSDIIIRNTDIREGEIPDNVFYVAKRRRR